MLKPHVAFSIGGSFAMLSWLALSVSLFLSAPLRLAIWTGTTIAVPAVLALAYAMLLFRGLRDRTGGGFGSIAAVRQLFTSDAALAAGWLHYLAFDLFVGSWIAREGLASEVSPLLIVPCLLLTFLAGPVGFLLFIILRYVIAGRLGITV
jgi:hypothetical protein